MSWRTEVTWCTRTRTPRRLLSARRRPRPSVARLQQLPLATAWPVWLPGQGTWGLSPMHRITEVRSLRCCVWLGRPSDTSAANRSTNRVGASETGPDGESQRDAVAEHGAPASTLTDNGVVCTTRLACGRGGRNRLEHELRRGDRRRSVVDGHLCQARGHRWQDRSRRGDGGADSRSCR